VSNLHELDAYLVGLLAKLEAPQRRALARAVSVELRPRQSSRIEASPDTAVVTFRDEVKRVAAVHHFGLRDRVNARAGLPSNTRHESY